MSSLLAAPDSVTLVKLGGSLITDKSRPLTARPETIGRLAEEIHEAGLGEGIVLGHGSGSFGHVVAAAHAIHRGVHTAEQVEGVADTQIHAHRLHRLIVDSLWRAGHRPFSVAPSSCVIAAAGKPESIFLEPVLGALRLGLTPVLLGDVVTDSEWGASICSTEAVFELLVESLAGVHVGIDRVLWIGATDGVLDAEGATIPRVDATNHVSVMAASGGSEAEDVTGGMRLRVETAWRLARRGVPSWIGNGLVPGRLRDALLGRRVKGTDVEPPEPD